MKNRQREEAAAPWAAFGQAAGDLAKIGTHFQDQQRARDLAALEWNIKQGKAAAELGNNELAAHYYNQVAEKAKPLFGDNVTPLAGGTKQQGWEDEGTPSADGRSYSLIPHTVKDWNNPQTVGAMHAMFGVDPPKITELNQGNEAGYLDPVTRKWVQVRAGMPKPGAYQAHPIQGANGPEWATFDPRTATWARGGPPAVPPQGPAPSFAHVNLPPAAPGGQPIIGRFNTRTGAVETTGQPAYVPPRHVAAPTTIEMTGPDGRPGKFQWDEGTDGWKRIGDVKRNPEDEKKQQAAGLLATAIQRKFPWAKNVKVQPGSSDLILENFAATAPTPQDALALERYLETHGVITNEGLAPVTRKRVGLVSPDIAALRAEARPPSGFVWQRDASGVETLTPAAAGVTRQPAPVKPAPKARPLTPTQIDDLAIKRVDGSDPHGRLRGPARDQAIAREKQRILATEEEGLTGKKPETQADADRRRALDLMEKLLK